MKSTTSSAEAWDRLLPICIGVKGSMVSFSRRPSIRCEDPLSLISRVKTKLYTTWISCTYPFISRGKKISVHYSCVLSRQAASHIKLGSAIVIRKDTWLNVIVGRVGEIKLTIEDNCSLGYRTSISAKNSIHLERNVIIAASVLIQDHNHAYEDINYPIREQGVTAGGRVRIEEGCWIGQGVAIVCSKGELVIGRNSVVGANSVVTKSFPPYSVIVGSPARLAKQYDPMKNVWVVNPGVGETEVADELLEWETEKV